MGLFDYGLIGQLASNGPQGLVGALGGSREGQGQPNRLSPRLSAKKGGAAQPPPMAVNPNVPTATGDFYQRLDPTARQALLRAMIERSRAGRQTGA
jgi:hypothetical protein